MADLVKGFTRSSLDSGLPTDAVLEGDHP